MSIKVLHQLFMNYNPCHSVRQILCLIKIDVLRPILILLIHFFFYSRHYILTNLDTVEYGQPLKCTVFGIPNLGVLLHL